MVGKICAHLERPYVIGGTSMSLTASIGTAIYPSDGKDCSDLLQVSDLAMYGKKTWDSAPRSS